LKRFSAIFPIYICILLFIDAFEEIHTFARIVYLSALLFAFFLALSYLKRKL